MAPPNIPATATNDPDAKDPIPEKKKKKNNNKRTKEEADLKCHVRMCIRQRDALRRQAKNPPQSFPTKK
jgi:hypothetical protein